MSSNHKFFFDDKFIKNQDGTYKQLKEKLILIGGVLPFR